MAYTDYSLGGDGIYSFVDPSTGQSLNAAGPSAMAKAKQIDDMRMASAAPGSAAGVRESLFGDAGGAKPGVPPSATDAAGVPAAIARPDTKPPTLADMAKWDSASKVANVTQGPQSTEGRIAASLGLPETTIAKRLAADGAKPVDITAKPDEKAPPVAPGSIVMSQHGGRPTGAPGGPTLFGTPVTGLGPTGGSGAVTPAHERLAARTTQSEVVPELARDQTTEAYKERAAGIGELAGAEQKRADSIASVTRDSNTALEKQESDARLQEANRREEWRRNFAKADALGSELNKEPIDSEAIWKDKGAGAKFAAGIAAAMGAWGASMTGGPNMPLQIINKAIDDNIDAQKARKAGKKSEFDAANTMLGHYRELLGDDRAAEAEARKTMLDQASRRIDEATKGTESPIVLARANAAKDALRIEWAKQNEVTQTYKESRQYQEVPAQQVGAGRPVLHLKLNGDQVVKTADGQLWTVKSGKEGDTVRERIGKGNEILDKIEGFKALAGNKANYVTPEGRALIRQSAAAIKADAGKEGDFNARFSGDASKFLDNLIGSGDDPDAISHVLTNAGQLAALDQFGHQVKQSQRHILAAQDSIPINKSYHTNLKTGELEENYLPAGPAASPVPQGFKEVGAE